VRNRAVAALASIGEPALKAVNPLLKLSLADKPEDRRCNLDKEIAITLSKLIKDPYKLELDRELFYAAVNKFLGHPHHDARRSAMRLISKIPLADFPVVADKFITVIKCTDQSYQTYHNDADRATGMAILEKLNVDAIDLCMETLEANIWGQKWRVSGVNGRLATLVKYGANAKRVLPQLKEMRGGESPMGKLGANVDEFLKQIEESTETRKLISLEEAVKGREVLKCVSSKVREF